jgi:hypothetical protein
MTCATCGCSTVENWAFIGSIILLTCGVVALIYAHSSYDRLAAEKYRKVNAISLATPGLVLIAFGVFIMMFPLVIHHLENKKEATSVNIAVIGAAPKPPVKKNNTHNKAACVLLPVDQNKCLTPFAITLLDDTAKSLSSTTKLQIIVSSYGFEVDAKEAEVAVKQAIALLGNRGVKNCTAKRKQCEQRHQGTNQSEIGVCISIQNGGK